ncbi:ADP-heptose:LPS heptosyltransferase [Prosthecobacter debontii]|uniref:ADP-heptose:LPS heptosyltransferase n=1 Tax=Prosthecobacter debontii TaxID=48467 RepID=A0A1T4WTE2_9BACT|nr:glycosyltransferase family 9 protein [Prosthecobacter debontii]SKA80118.1 ADP-heptose:LPS heptosyltransferase [Prosthecobacter debontii]
MKGQPPRVLVIRGGAIGDFVLTLPAIRLIRQNIPGCHLEVLGYPGIMDLAVTAGLADATRSLEHRSMALLFAKGAALDPALVDYLRSFNLVVSYLFDPDGILKGQMEAVGVKTYLECPHQVLPGQGHAAEQLARPLEKLAMFLEPEPDWRSPLFQFGEPLSKKPRIALHLGSGSVKKTWPVEHWLQVTKTLREVMPETELVLITGEAEQERGLTAGFEEAERWHSLPLPELAARLCTCRLFLGHDSGISHLASACGVPSFLLFGPTDPATWAPPQAQVTVVQAEGGVWELLLPEKVTEALVTKVLPAMPL